MGRRTNRDDRKATHKRPGRNLSQRARADRQHRSAEELDEQRSEQRSERSSRSSSERRPVPTICPKGKKGYPEAIAREKLAAYAESGRPEVPTRVYPCSDCGSWHLTSRSARRPETSRPSSPTELDGKSRSRPPIPPPGRAPRPPEREAG